MDASFFMKLTPLENLDYAAGLYGLDKEKAKTEAEKILKELGFPQSKQPVSGRIKVVIIRINVDLPQPLGPNIPKTLLFFTVNEIFFTEWNNLAFFKPRRCANPFVFASVKYLLTSLTTNAYSSYLSTFILFVLRVDVLDGKVTSTRFVVEFYQPIKNCTQNYCSLFF